MADVENKALLISGEVIQQVAFMPALPVPNLRRLSVLEVLYCLRGRLLPVYRHTGVGSGSSFVIVTPSANSCLALSLAGTCQSQGHIRNRVDLNWSAS